MGNLRISIGAGVDFLAKNSPILDNKSASNITGWMTCWPDYQFMYHQIYIKWFKMTRSKAIGYHSSNLNQCQLNTWLQCYLNIHMFDKICTLNITGLGSVLARKVIPVLTER